MQLKLTLFIFFTSIYIGNAQFINAEALRNNKDSTGFSGTIGLNFDLVKNTKNILAFGNTIFVKYKNKKHMAFFINYLSYKKINDDDIINKGTQHLRYNYEITNIITWEVFAQLHYNTISKIDKRQLFGSGARFRLIKTKKYASFLGTVLMFEHEVIDAKPNITNDDFRLSTYIVFKLNPKPNFSFSSVNFYQPRIDKFNDYRLHSINTLTFNLFKNFNANMTYAIHYDAFPAGGVPNTQYEFLNGFSYTFD